MKSLKVLKAQSIALKLQTPLKEAGLLEKWVVQV